MNDERNKLSIKPFSENEYSVVFMGDSITQAWSDTSPEFFKNKPYLERGIGGQTTPQMIDRFNKDVLDLQPNVVVILAGTNDIAGNTGKTTNTMIQKNLSIMVEMAQQHGIKVILSSILPAYDYPWRPGTFPAQRIIDMNAWIKSYCVTNGLIYLDYWTSMAAEDHGLKDEYTFDGVHVTRQGYEVMEHLVEIAIQESKSE